VSDVHHFDDVDWQVDEDGTDFFVRDGQRYELDDDGYAYVVGPASGDAADDPDRTGPVPTVTVPGTSPGSTAGTPPASATGTPPASAATTDAILRLSGVRSGYGNLPVLHGVDLEIGTGQTAVLLGLNGAGKTTTAMNVCGALDTWEGRIEFDGEDASSWSTRRCVTNGIVMVPEGRRVFPELDVSRNLQVGGWAQRRDGDWIAEQREQVLEYFPRLRERLAQQAGTLSGGEQQMLAIARGLMARPRLLIIDEASMGLAPVIVHAVFDIIRRINEDGVTVLLIEQNVGALDVADVGIVMAQGRVVRELRGEELTDRSAVSEILMG
jgi:branched-chain amino acid transport system ATP-binding protein